MRRCDTVRVLRVRAWSREATTLTAGFTHTQTHTERMREMFVKSGEHTDNADGQIQYRLRIFNRSFRAAPNPSKYKQFATVRYEFLYGSDDLLYSYSYSYEAGRLYGRLEGLRQCAQENGPTVGFRCCFRYIWATTIRQQREISGRGMSHGGCWAKVAISAQGVHGRSNIGSAAQTQFTCSVKTNHMASCARARPTKSLEHFF